VGNAVISGHRTTYGAPFNRFDELVPGTPVVVETADAWLTYRVTEQRIVSPTAVEVTWPVPGRRDVDPTERLLTFTTCHPEYSARERLVVHAVLESEALKDAGPPPALAG
jgi:sortase A